MRGAIPRAVPADFRRTVSIIADAGFESDMTALTEEIVARPHDFSLSPASDPRGELSTRIDLLDGREPVISFPSLAGWPFAGPCLYGMEAPEDGIRTLMAALLSSVSLQPSAKFQEVADGCARTCSAVLLAEEPGIQEGCRDEQGKIEAMLAMEAHDGTYAMVLHPPADSDLERLAWHLPLRLSASMPLVLEAEKNAGLWNIDAVREYASGRFVSMPAMDPMEAMRSAAAYGEPIENHRKG